MYDHKPLINYKEYLLSSHWQGLITRHIRQNKKAQCFVCDLRFRLLLHHKNYNNLYHEKLHRDMEIVCYDCHDKIHFKFFGLIKVPLVPEILEKRMYLLKARHQLLSLNIPKFAYYLTISLI